MRRLSQPELELQHLKWPRRTVAEVGPAAFAALSRSVVPGTVQGICVCPTPPLPTPPFTTGWDVSAQGAGFASGCQGVGGDTGAGSRRVPYVTPVLMVLYDNGSMQCFTSPAHLSAVERERSRHAGVNKAGGSGHAGVGAGGSGAVSASNASSKGVTASSVAGGGNDAQPLSAPSQRSQGAPKPPPPPPPPMSPPTRNPIGLGRAGAARAADSSVAAASLMDATGRMSIAGTPSSSPAPTSKSSTKTAPGASAGSAPGPGSSAANRTSRRSGIERDERGKKSEPSTPATSSHRGRRDALIWERPAAVSPSLTTLEGALADRRRRAQERLQRIAWGGGGGEGASRRSASPSARRSGNEGAESIGASAGRPARRIAGGPRGPPCPTAAATASRSNNSSGHESTSEDEAFSTFRSQVRGIYCSVEHDGATKQETSFQGGQIRASM